MDAGVFKWGKLSKQLGRQELLEAIDDGRLIRLRRGWYATELASREARSAVEAGGVLSCVSALALHDVWVPDRRRVHLRGNDRSAREHPQWCRQFGRQPPEFEAVDDLLTSLRHAARCLPSEDFIVICDSIINTGLMTHDDLVAEFADRPRNFQKRLDLIDGRAESGIETMVRLRLQAEGIAMRPQAVIPMIGRVDFLVGRSLITEVDGANYHYDPDSYENDRLRDLRAHALGYHPIRLTYRQVVYEWAAVRALILEAIAHGVHRRPVDVPPLDTTAA